MIIAIDGPAASGKTSVSLAVAKAIKFRPVQSGLLYRAIAWAVNQKSIELPDSTSDGSSSLSRDFSISFQGNIQIVKYRERDISTLLTGSEVNETVPIIAKLLPVRDLVTVLLINATAGENSVVEGRDIGTSVFPTAEYKFFLDACPIIRQNRRDQEGLIDSVAERDRHDRERKQSPLIKARDAVTIDTGHQSFAEVVTTILGHLKDRPLRLNQDKLAIT